MFEEKQINLELKCMNVKVYAFGDEFCIFSFNCWNEITFSGDFFPQALLLCRAS